MDPLHAMLIDAAVRRSNADAFQRSLELADARNTVLDVGPDRDRVTDAVWLRSFDPKYPERNIAMARLAAATRGISGRVETRSVSESTMAHPYPRRVVKDERGNLLGFYGDPDA